MNQAEFKKDVLSRIAKARKVTAPENSVGQWIGYCLWHGSHSVFGSTVESYLEDHDLNLELKPGDGDKQVRLPDSDGTLKQIDHAFFVNGKPVVIAESKWLKDQRHLNDKGSWLKLMREIVRESDSVEQAVLVLAGPWESYRAQMENRGFKVIITSVDDVYAALKKHGVVITIDQKRNAFEDPGATLNSFLNVIEKMIEKDPNPFATIGKSMLGDRIRLIEKTIEEVLEEVTG